MTSHSNTMLQNFIQMSEHEKLKVTKCTSKISCGSIKIHGM